MKYISTALLFVFVVFTIGTGVYVVGFSPPRDFPSGQIITVKEGQTLLDVSNDLKDKNVVRSAFLLRFFVIFYGGERSVGAGDYLLKSPENVLRIAEKITQGLFGVEPLRITFPEGLRLDQMADILEEKIGDFDREIFLDLAKDKEGYLFPDTYFFPRDSSETRIIEIMESNFERQISKVESDIEGFGKSLQEVIIMASLLEGEARKIEDKRMIADILWRRVEANMPLQVDAVFPFIFKQSIPRVLFSHLEVDSPYNTYLNLGLPPGPISSPGLDSIRAAVTPKQNKYFFYLSDRVGRMYYATDFEEHKQNRQFLNVSD